MDILEKLGITPGPWKTRQEVDGGYAETETWIVNDKKGIAKTTNQTRGQYFRGSKEEHEANAKLISAAPEMLYSLIVDIILYDFENENLHYSPIIENNRKIVEKATGKTWQEIKDIYNGSKGVPQ